MFLFWVLFFCGGGCTASTAASFMFLSFLPDFFISLAEDIRLEDLFFGEVPWAAGRVMFVVPWPTINTHQHISLEWLCR